MNDFIDFLTQSISEFYYLIMVLILRLFYDWNETSFFQKIQNGFVGGILAVLAGKFCDNLQYDVVNRDLIVWSCAFFGMEALSFIHSKLKKYWKKNSNL